MGAKASPGMALSADSETLGCLPELTGYASGACWEHPPKKPGLEKLPPNSTP